MSTTAHRSGKEAVTFTDPVTGREVLQLTNSQTMRSVHGYYDLPPWSPKDGRIAFSSMAPRSSECDVYVMDRDGGNLRFLAHSRSASSNDGAMAQWSFDGKRIYYKQRVGSDPVIAWVNPDSGEHGDYPGDLRMLSAVANQNVYFSDFGRRPDQDLLRYRDQFGVFVQDLGTGASRRVVSVEQCRLINPRCDQIADWHLYIKHTKWSPDGKRIMFVFTNEIRFAPKYAELPHVKDIYVVNADGTGLKRVGEFGNHPLWHPNGQEILTNSPYEGRIGNSLVLLNADTGARRLAARHISGSGHPSFSPDGRYIVVDHVLPGEGSGSINLVDVAADTVEHLAQLRVLDHSHVGTHLHPVWSQDGKQLLYDSDASGMSQLCVVNIA